MSFYRPARHKACHTIMYYLMYAAQDQWLCDGMVNAPYTGTIDFRMEDMNKNLVSLRGTWLAGVGENWRSDMIMVELQTPNEQWAPLFNVCVLRPVPESKDLLRVYNEDGTKYLCSHMPESLKEIQHVAIMTPEAEKLFWNEPGLTWK